MSKHDTTRTNLSKSVIEMLLGNERYLARLITLVESENEAIPDIMQLIFHHLGKAFKIGITGPPGAGKSTLVEKLTKVARSNGRKVGIICVDPSSPCTGGAILGDRIRMDQHYLDDGVYIRSMATRGSLGGITNATSNVVKLLDAFGKDLILIETVGVGQTETDILGIADLVIVVLVPEAGDTIQAMKAGILEIADIIVVNKADRPGAENLAAELAASINLREKKDLLEKSVLTAEAANNVGIDQLYMAIQKRHEDLKHSGQFEERRKQQRRKEFLNIVEKKVISELLDSLEHDSKLADYLGKVEGGISEPYSTADEMLRKRLL
jgi:LAO/AO transport system kinase